jgi:hypothetical protein
MRYCVRCGHVLNSEDVFCSICGMRQPDIPPENYNIRPNPNYPNNYYNQPNTQYAPNAQYIPNAQRAQSVQNAPKSRHKSGFIGYIVWSLILVSLFNIIGTPLGIAATLLLLDGDNSSGPDSDRKFDTAAVLCIVGTVVDLISLIFLVFMALRNIF